MINPSPSTKTNICVNSEASPIYFGQDSHYTLRNYNDIKNENELKNL